MKLHIGEPAFEAKSYERLGDLEGFSHELIDTHIGLYRGYVDHANQAHELLRAAELDEIPRSEVRRRFGWEYNGMRLHELYFDGLTPGGNEVPDALKQALKAEFGSFDAWTKDIREVATMRGIGWAALVHDPATKRFFNTWIDEHDAGALVGTEPVLLIDVFEHAFMPDFGTDRDAYLDATFNNIDWTTCQGRVGTLA